MSIVRYRQWPLPAALHNEIKYAFGRFGDGEAAAADAPWVPGVDIKEEAGRFVIRADLPGVDPREIEIQMDKNILSIRGERSAEQAAENERFARAERRHGRFHRRFALPESADAERISASGRNGVLEIVIPKKAEVAPRRIAVGSPTVQ
ncbi:Hsp20/alpha crystallin family protein [Luteimonas aquatica]|uniref:Hsp20/alpha crystallin family protein n=1 Tax=Luteimonas aquatica TaxID=450364 RepID=UPI001F58C43F|nr:Hsp20/alpha crystallin family protein [Luteimonas aquatica]